MVKRKNVFQRYFENFGLKQLSDIFMLISLITLIVGWIIWQTTEVVLLISFALFVVTSLLSVIRCIKIIRSEPNKRSPERKAAIVNLIIMVVILLIAAFALIWGLAVGFSVPAIN